MPELGPDQALLQVPRNYHRYTRQIEHHKLAGRCTSKRLREVAMVHDAETGKCRLLSTSDRDYGVLKPTETPGTADVVIAGFRTAEVWDYKTGRWPVPASGNPQLEHLALMAVRTVAPEATQVVVGIQTLASYGKVVTESAVVDTLSLDEHEAKVREAQERATRVQAQIEAGEEPDVYPGDHCMFCPAQPGCPAHKEK